MIAIVTVAVIAVATLVTPAATVVELQACVSVGNIVNQTCCQNLADGDGNTVFNTCMTVGGTVFECGLAKDDARERTFDTCMHQ